MSRWQSINTAPKNGKVVNLRRVHEGRVVSEGRGAYRFPDPKAPQLSQLPPDPLGRAWPAEVVAATTTPREHWMQEDGMFTFPEPTHWMPLDQEMPEFVVTLRRIQGITVTVRAPSAAHVRRLAKTEEGQDTLSELATSDGVDEFTTYQILDVRKASHDK